MVPQFDPPVWTSVAIAIQACGLFAACLTRLSRGSRGQTCCAALFLLTLVAVALSTMASISQGHAGGWLAGGASLGIMVLLAVWERPTVALDEAR